MKTNSFKNSCEICGKQNWIVHYTGQIRDGSFGKLTSDERTVFLCKTCGVQRLEESDCKNEDFYTGNDYRILLGEGTDAATFWAEHDVTQLRNLNVLKPHRLRNKTVADIGCAAGSFLDHIKGLAKSCLAIEPCVEYHDSLQNRGYLVFNSTIDAVKEYSSSIDFAFSFSVIEHVANPLEFLGEVKELLHPEGLLLVSTPNRNDILMHLLDTVYHRFFYRTVHRWYFDRASFCYLAKQAGFEVNESLCLQRFGISNALAWLRDRKPTGEKPLQHMDDPIINEFWKSYLSFKGLGDYLYFLLKKAR